MQSHARTLRTALRPAAENPPLGRLRIVPRRRLAGKGPVGRTSRPALVVPFLLFVCGSIVSAQSEPSDQPPAPPDRTIYVPYTNLSEFLKRQAASALVPYEEYLKFLRESRGTKPEAPVDAVISESTYAGKIEEDLARVTATYKVRVLGKPWVELPLNFGDAAVGKVDGGGSDVLLRGTGDGTYALLFGKTGEHTVTIELVTRVRTSPDGREFTLSVPPVGITKFDLTIPQADQVIDIEPRQAGESKPAESAADVSRISTNLGSTAKITARWRPKASLKPDMDLLASVDNRQLVTIDGGLVHHDAWLTWKVLRGSVQTLRVAVPLGHRVLDVSADKGVKSWESKDEAQRQVVTIELLSPSESSVTVELHTEGPQPEGELPVGGLDAASGPAGIHALDATRESGQIAVRVGDDAELAVVEQIGLTRIGVAEADPHLKPAAGTAFKFYSSDFRLKVAARTVEPRILVSQETKLVFSDEELSLQAELKYTIERAGLFELSLKVPEELVVDDVQSPQVEADAFDESTRTLTVRLRQRTTGEVTVSVRGHRPLAAGNLPAFDLPILEPLNVTRETGRVAVYAPAGTEVVTSEEGLTSVQPAPAPAETQQGDARLTSTWRYSRRPVRIPVTTTRKPTRLSATIATAVDVQPETVEVITALDYLVEFAGLDTFKFLVPEGVSSSVQIEAEGGAAIKQKSPGAIENGWVPWTIVMQRDVTGRQRFRISYRLTGDGAAAPAADAKPAVETALQKLALQLVRPQGSPAGAGGAGAVPLTQVRGEVRITKERSLSVSAEVAGGDIEAIDVRELTLLPADGALAYRYFRQPEDAALSVNLTKSRHKIQEVVPTVVERGLIEVALSRHTAATYRCRYRIKTVERQRLRIDLPKGLDLLGVFVNGAQEKLNPLPVSEAGQVPEHVDAYTVNIARAGDSSQAFLLTLQFNWNVNPPPFESPYGRGTITFPLPRIGGSQAPAQVQELRTALYAPTRFWLVRTPTRFSVLGQRPWWQGIFGRPQTTESADGDWIGDSSPTLQFPTEGLRAKVYTSLGRTSEIEIIWWDSVMMTALLSIALALIGFILLRTNWENKLTVLLILGLAAMLFGVRDPDALAHGIAAARFGLGFLILLWVLHGLLGRDRSGAPQWSKGPYPWSGAAAYAASPPPETPKAPASPSGNAG